MVVIRIRFLLDMTSSESSDKEVDVADDAHIVFGSLVGPGSSESPVFIVQVSSKYGLM